VIVLNLLCISLNNQFENILKPVLYPFSILYDGITRARNYLYNSGAKRSIHFDTVVISVGNLTVGGTGKTPHVEYLIRLLKNHYKLATLSRGYGRKTKGFIIAGVDTDASVIGDEPRQFYNKFSDEIVVTVGEERILAIPEILHQNPETEIILLDDAFQHRKVEPDVNILLSDYNRPFYDDFVLPSGRLRESRVGAIRADLIIVTKCPENVSENERNEIVRRIKKYTSRTTPIYFTRIKYSEPKPFRGFDSLRGEVLLVSGIARSEGLEQFVREKYNFYKHLKFKDHHQYSLEDLAFIKNEFEKMGKEGAILITEKDMVKWMDSQLFEIVKEMPVFYLPIEIEFTEDGERFDQWILAKVKERLNELGK
jgi:tetraacyldisaccharide 4'-kinase